jgi:hypothetical protein
MFRRAATFVARDFRANPVDYVAEADLQFAVVEALRSTLSPATASVRDPRLRGVADGFKREYPDRVERRLTETGELNRVHAEVSVRQGERLDVAVFRPEITAPVDWVSGGSKRFDEGDLSCVYELKFVKNKTSFPKHTGHPVAELADEAPTVEALLDRVGSDDPVLDLEENKLRPDVEELNRLDGVDERYLLLFSNNNYLYHDPTAREVESNRYGRLYRRMGAAARRWLRDEAGDGTEVLYVHPRGTTWLTGDPDESKG